MADESTIERLARIAYKALGALSFLPPLLARLVIGYSFYVAGSPKYTNPANFVDLFKDWGIPMPELNVFVVGRLECFGGVLIMVGLATRPVAAMLGGSMLVAVFTAHHDQFFDMLAKHSDLTDISPIYLGLFMLYFLVYGPGEVSLDAVLKWAFGIKAKPGPEPAQVQAPAAASIEAAGSRRGLRIGAILAVAVLALGLVEYTRESAYIGRMAAIPEDANDTSDKIERMTGVLKEETDADVRETLQGKIKWQADHAESLKAELEVLRHKTFIFRRPSQ